MESGYVTSGTASIYYEIYGHGRPILFIHGNGEDMTYFKYQKKEFIDKYKLVFIDSRGHGKSSFGDENLTLDLMSEDVLRVLNEIGIKKVDLLGFSDGGNIGIITALKKAEVLRTLTLVGANLKPDDLIYSERVQIKKEFMLEEDEKKKAVLNLMIDEPNINDEELRKIYIPTLVIAGENDLIEEDCTKRIAHNIRESRLEIIKNADHFLMEKMPEKFNHIFMNFINNH